MPEKILGLDIGTDTIKAVQVTAGLKEYEVLSIRNVTIMEFGDREKAIRALLEDDIYRNNVCITSLPMRNFSFRNIRLPFKAKKKISQTIPYELEPLLPFPIDDAVIDHVIVNQTDQSEILAAVIQRSYVEQLFQLLREYQIEASIIDIDPVSIALKLLSSGIVEGCGLLLDIGAQDTSGVLFTNGRIHHVRHYDFGGEDVTRAIADSLGIRVVEAEKKKRIDRTVHTKEEILNIYENFFQEIKNTLQFLKLKGGPESEISKIFLTGGGAIDEFLKKEMERFFSVPVETVDVSQTDTISFTGTTKEEWHPMRMNQALALATRQTKRAGGFNFAVGEFGPVKKYEKFRKEVIGAAAVIFAALILFGVDIFIDYHYDRAYLNQLKNRISTVFKESAPEVNRIIDPVHQMKVLIAEARKSSSGINGSGSSVLDIMNTISRLIPETTDFLITSFTFDGTTIEIKGETDNFNTVDTIKSALGNFPQFQDVKISSASLIKKGTRVGFDVRMNPR